MAGKLQKTDWAESLLDFQELRRWLVRQPGSRHFPGIQERLRPIRFLSFFRSKFLKHSVAVFLCHVSSYWAKYQPRASCHSSSWVSQLVWCKQNTIYKTIYFYNLIYNVIQIYHKNILKCYENNSVYNVYA